MPMLLAGICTLWIFRHPRTRPRVEAGYAYVADSYGSVRTVDVQDPIQPTEVGYYALSETQATSVMGSYVYVADSYGGLVVLWFSPPATAQIPTSGGDLVSPADSTTYSFPSGTFTDTVAITHVARFPGNAPSGGDLVGAGHVFSVTAVYSDTGQPAQPTGPYTVTVGYTDAERGPVIESTLALYYWDGIQWVQEPSSIVIPGIDTVRATPGHMSLWALLGETERVFLPVVLKNR